MIRSFLECSLPPNCLDDATQQHTFSPSLTHLAYLQHRTPLTMILSRGHHDTPTPVPDHPRLADAGIFATALTYIAAPVNPTTKEVLFVGYTDGSVRAYSATTKRLLFSERYHARSPILQIKAQSTPVFQDSNAGEEVESSSSSSASSSSPTRRNNHATGPLPELWMLHQDGTLVVLHVGQALRAMRATTNDIATPKVCLHRKWRLQRNRTCTDFTATTPSRTTSVFETHVRPYGANVLVVGQDPFCSVFLADGDAAKQNPITLRSAALELGSVVLSSAADVAASFLPSWWSSSSSSLQQQQQQHHAHQQHATTVPWHDASSSRLALKRHRPLFDAPRLVRSAALSVSE